MGLTLTDFTPALFLLSELDPDDDGPEEEEDDEDEDEDPEEVDALELAVLLVTAPSLILAKDI